MTHPLHESFLDLFIVSKPVINDEISLRIRGLSLVLAHFTNASSCRSVNRHLRPKLALHPTDDQSDTGGQCGDL